MTVVARRLVLVAVAGGCLCIASCILSIRCVARDYAILMQGGSVMYISGDPFSVEGSPQDGFELGLSDDISILAWLPFWAQSPDGTFAVVPLWVLAVISGCAAMGTFAARKGSPRHRPAVTCASCQYDLTGNVSGRCPECGMMATSVTSRSSAG